MQSLSFKDNFHVQLAGDVFLRPPEESEQDVDFVIPPQITDEYTSVYKKYTVYKKLAMIMSRQERVLAIDGDYVYIMAPETKNLFDTVKTVFERIFNLFK